MADALEIVGLSDYADRQISQLSGGQFQRVLIARCLVQEADYIFLDEPFVGIDSVSEEIIMNTLRDLKKLVKQFSSSIMTSAKSPLFRPSFASQSRINRPWSDRRNLYRGQSQKGLR